MRSRVCFLFDVHGRLSWGGGYVCVDRKFVVKQDVMDGVQFFFVFIILQLVSVQPIIKVPYGSVVV